MNPTPAKREAAFLKIIAVILACSVVMSGLTIAATANDIVSFGSSPGYGSSYIPVTPPQLGYSPPAVTPPMGFSIMPFSTANVSDQAQLFAAISDSAVTHINLTADITLGSQLPIPVGRNILLTSTDGNFALRRSTSTTMELIHMAVGTHLTLENITIDGMGISSGNALIGNHGTLIMNDGAVIQNNRSSASTGAVGNASNGTFIMNGGYIRDNESLVSGGGVRNVGTFTMYNGSIVENDAASQGGGVLNDGTFVMHNGNIIGNTANGRGGGVFISGNNTFEMFNGLIYDNRASSGGGVSFTDGTFTMHNGRIEKMPILW